jgi:hypothetical protein
MKAIRATVFCLVCAPLLVVAKGPTLKITIKGQNLASSVQITDERILEKFAVWAGTGVCINNTPQTEGFIVDWEKGLVAAPQATLPRYEVSFHVMHQRPSDYVVYYAYDPATGRGYVYLPGKGEKFYESNTFLILRGIEGNWLSATGSWTKIARPLIERAKAEGQAWQ